MFIVNKSKKVINITIPTGTKRIMAGSYLTEHGTYHRKAIEEIVAIYGGNLILVDTEQEAIDLLEEKAVVEVPDTLIIENESGTISIDTNNGSVTIDIPKDSDLGDIPDDFKTEEIVEIEDIQTFLTKMTELSIETKAELLKDIEQNPEAVIESVTGKLIAGRTEEQVARIKEELTKSPSTILDVPKFQELLDSVNTTELPEVITIDDILASDATDDVKLIKAKELADKLNIQYHPNAGLKNLVKKLKKTN